ncbi:MAG TPA: 2Fe-2S iron-sulfur cluster-binding protein, partial [Acidimicrobiales bacterium]|nr:2Fe-2S iron-sulfur cluster-binding protein [Acidimicrobiales bacterium]
MADTTAETVTITVDGKQVQARAGELLIAACEDAGVYIPRFCYHPRMKPVGMCRMCLVEVKGPRGFSLTPACYVPVAEGMEVQTRSDKVKKAQDGVLEFLLVNHPLDCPVCDKGGECPLQDFSYNFGRDQSRMEFPRRVFDGEGVKGDVDFGPTLMLNRQRCILCTRCVRFMRDVEG